MKAIRIVDFRRILFIFYLMYLPLAQIVWSGTVGWLLRHELTETRKAVLVA